MKFLIGLGNPGKRYASTRHNLGFMLVDKIAEKFGSDFRDFSGLALVGSLRVDAEEILLLKPQAYVNRSGLAVRKVADKYDALPEQMMVAHDDADLLFGRIRLKGKGGSGGHRGVESIIEEIGSNEFPRLRMGVGREFMEGELADYLLSPFHNTEFEGVESLLETGASAIEVAVRLGILEAMRIFNRIDSPGPS
jgi:PTH1 family peptidyl-tRNA hydrolase